jgi:hypothetical protein
LRLADEQCFATFMDQFGIPYAAIEVGDHIETVAMKSSRFRNWLCRIFYKSEGKILTSENVTNVISVLKARAEFDSSPEEDAKSLNLRVSSRPEEPNAIYYDLTNKNWDFVRITPKGWNVAQSSKITPIIFKRHPSQQPQVDPAKDHPADIFGRFMNLVNIKSQDNQLLLKCYIISLFYPDIPKPVLMLHGEQGAAKSTLQELIKMLVDPSSVKTLTFPRDITELVQKLSHNYIAYFDNVSSIHEWISDQLCRAVTGSGFSKRELYTDDDDIIYNFKRCIGFNGINLGAAKPDLLDRGLIIELERIVKIRKVEDIWAEFDLIKPQLLAYIFDLLVQVLKSKSNGGVELQTFPRMADFAEIGEIISRCMGNDKDAFINAYNRNIELQTEEAIAANLLGNAMIQFVQDKPEWIGTASRLHMELEAKAAVLNINVHDKSWPKSANSLSRKLNLIKTNLREIGIEVDKCYLDEKRKSRGVKIRKISSEPSKREEESSEILLATDDTDDILHTSQGQEEEENNVPEACSSNSKEAYYYQCYHCDAFKTNNEADFERHNVVSHPGKGAYPNKAEIEKRGLKPQGKPWET